MSQNSGMPKKLNPEEINVLSALAEAFPENLHLQQLAPRTSLSTDQARLLRILDALIARGLIECTPLRGSEGLVDAANILISNAGNNLLEQLDRESQGKAKDRNVSLQPIKATILNVLIASPSDVSAERDAVVSAIHDWNASHHARTGLMLNPIRWETHSYPAAGDRPQAILNRQIVDSGHLLIGIFGNRLGTPTGEAQSGTIEEIERFRKTGRHVALYFSNAPVPRNTDRDQLEALEKYRRDRQQDTLYFAFATAEELRRLVTQHLPNIVSEVYEGLQHAKSNADALLTGLDNTVIWNPAIAPEQDVVSQDVEFKSLPNPIKILLGRDHPNGIRFLVIYGRFSTNLYWDLPKVEGIGAFGELNDDFYLQAGFYDFGNTGDPELILAIGDGVSMLTAFVYKYSGGHDPTTSKAWVRVAELSGQSKLVLEHNRVLTPYGSQGLADEYVWDGHTLSRVDD